MQNGVGPNQFLALEHVPPRVPRDEESDLEMDPQAEPEDPLGGGLVDHLRHSEDAPDNFTDETRVLANAGLHRAEQDLVSGSFVPSTSYAPQAHFENRPILEIRQQRSVSQEHAGLSGPQAHCQGPVGGGHKAIDATRKYLWEPKEKQNSILARPTQ